MTVADGDCTFQVETSGKALSWFNRPCHIALIGGAGFNAAIPPGAFPFRLPRPVHVPASGAIVTVCTDLGTIAGGGANRVQITFHGLRLYPSGGIPVDEATASRMLERGLV